MSTEREKILLSAQKWIDKKRYDRAVEDYQKVVALDPNDARTLLKIGDLQARMQAYPEAIATYDRVGAYYAGQGFALKAIAVYKQIRELIRKHAPELAPRYEHIVPRLAEIYTQLGLTSDALQAYDEVATTYQRGGQDQAAIDVFRRMVALDSTNPLPHLRLAEACCRVQAVGDAIDAFWTAAELLLKLGRRDDALKVIERILHFKTEPKYARAAAELYLARGEHEDGMQALARLQICFQADPKDIDTLGLLAQAFTVIGQPDKSLEVYKEMAGIARDSGKQELFAQLVQHLVALAPNDERVRVLAAGSVPPPAKEPSTVHVADDDVELFEEEEEVEVAEPDSHPFALNRPSYPELRAQRSSSPDVVAVSSDVTVAEEFGADARPSSFELQEHGKKAVVDAEAFRRLRLYSKSVEVLHIALEVDPRSIEVREKLRDIYIESGDRDNAIGESVTLASLYFDDNDFERGEALLYEVLEAEPEHPAALEMLAQLSGDATEAGLAFAPDHHASGGYGHAADWGHGQPGYGGAANYGEGFGPEYSTETYSDAGYSPDNAYEADPYGAEAYDPNAPLPSYDLEGVGASSALGSTEPFAEESYPAAPTDDPYRDAAPDEPFSEHPLPSFPLGIDYASAPEHEPVTEAAADGIEEALEEAEFFVARGLYEDARAIVTDQLARNPGHPLLVERLREVDGILAAQGESRTIDRTRLEPVDEPEDDRAFDIAASLQALDQLESPAAPAQDIDVDRVFEKFKAGVRAQVSEADSATHYDLGVAYKEMGLTADAANEFELAAKDPARECMCYAMIGMIRLEQGELEQSARAYVRALEAPVKTVDQEMALYYDLGNVYEMKGANQEALYYFEKVARRDPGYRHVRDRIAALSPGRPVQKATPRAANGEEEFDSVFEDLFDSK